MWRVRGVCVLQVLYHNHRTRLRHVCDLQVICARTLDADGAAASGRGDAAATGGARDGGGGAPSAMVSTENTGTGTGSAMGSLALNITGLSPLPSGPSVRRLGPKPGMLPGLGLALRACPGLEGAHGAALAALKKAAHTLFDKEREGGHELWRERPLPPAIIEYAAADVAHLHKMRAAWGDAVGEAEMHEITTRRIEAAISSADLPKGPHMARRDF